MRAAQRGAPYQLRAAEQVAEGGGEDEGRVEASGDRHQRPLRCGRLARPRSDRAHAPAHELLLVEAAGEGAVLVAHYLGQQDAVDDRLDRVHVRGDGAEPLLERARHRLYRARLEVGSVNDLSWPERSVPSPNL